MLNLIESGFNRGGHRELTERIKKAVESGRRGYLIVPEQQTVLAEGEMSELLPPYAPRIFEVTNFTRFANTAFRSIGGICGEYASAAGKSLIMWKTLAELAPVLDLTRGRKNINPGLVSKALGAVAELQSSGITGDELGGLGKEELEERLKRKVKDLSLIYSLYKKLLGEKYVDTASDAVTLAELLREKSDYLTGYEIFIDGFISFTEPQYMLLKELMKRCEVTVHLTLPKNTESLFEYSEVKETKRRLTSLSDRLGIEKKLYKLDAPTSDFSPTLFEISDLLWRNEGVIDNDSLQDLDENGERVRIFSAKTPFTECDLVASDIQRRVQLGDSYSDFAIIARNAEKYRGILDTALSKAKIPHFLSDGSDVFSLEAVKLIFNAYAIIETGFRQEDVISYSKLSLSGVTREDKDDFEIYVTKWNIDGARFTDGLGWNMNPRGYEQFTDRDKEKLLRINATKDALIEPLMHFKEKALDSTTVKEQAEALLSFLTEIELEKRLNAKAKELFSKGLAKEADEEARLWRMICDSLDEVVNCLDDTPSGVESFKNQLSVVLSGVTISRIPQHIDEVVIGNADTLRISPRRHVYLLGVNVGEFPASITGSSYFTESDRIKLHGLGLPILPETDIKSARELYLFTKAFNTAMCTVTILYTELSSGFAPLLPSDVISRLEQLTRGKVRTVKAESLPLLDRIYSPTMALESLGEADPEEYEAIRLAVKETDQNEALFISLGNISNTGISLGENSLALLYKNEVYLTSSRIESFLGCPMKYFCENTLRLEEDRRAELSSNVVGSFIHYILESFFRELKARGSKINLLTRDEREALAKECSTSYVTDVFGVSSESARMKVSISRLVRASLPIIEGLCDEFSSCSYEPTFFELKLSDEKENAPERITLMLEDGRSIKLGGIIDRVDTLKSGEDVYVRVVDYKTGHIDFLPSKLKRGEYMQMFLYLMAVSEAEKPGFREAIGVGKEGRIIPAGVIYVKTKINQKPIKESSDILAEEAFKAMQEREGMVLLDPVSISAMNPDFLPPQPTERSRSTFERREYDEDGWREITETVKGIVTEVAERISGGEIAPCPSEYNDRICSYCKFSSFCRSAKKKQSY